MKRIFAVILCLSLVSCVSVVTVRFPPDTDDEMRGLWIASAMNIDFPSSANLSSNELTAEIDAIIEDAKRIGFNAIFLQVRPSSDALYRSEIYPVSKYLSSCGLYFDVLEYFIGKAHENEIALHAWVNPLRVTAEAHETEADAFASLDERCPAKLNPSLAVFYADGKLYYDCGLSEVRTLIADGITELVTNYDLDGVIIDDYFYPYPVYSDGSIAEFGDGDTYERYGGSLAIDDWRRENVNQLVKAIYGAVKNAREDCLFGVSPYGIWQNDDGKNEGSATVGLEAYSTVYADTIAWIDGGYVDYIAPQIPWRIGDSNASFDVLARWWNDAVEGTSVSLIISLAPYKYAEWNRPYGELTRQIALSRSLTNCIGNISYGYADIKKNTASVADELTAVYRK